MTIRESMLAEFDHEAATTRKLLDRVPDARLGWKPHAKSMSLGALATHLAAIPLWSGTILNEPFFDLASTAFNPDEKASRADILSAFDESVKRARGWMDKGDAEFMAPWTLKRGGQELFTLPRVAALRSFVISHLIHHRGQLSVYLRLNDIPVPPIYGPTADEGF